MRCHYDGTHHRVEASGRRECAIEITPEGLSEQCLEATQVEGSRAQVGSRLLELEDGALVQLTDHLSLQRDGPNRKEGLIVRAWRLRRREPSERPR